MTPPTPDLTALEQWARQELEYLTAPDIKGDPDSIASLQSALALCEAWRAQQAELTKWQTCSGCGEQMDAPGHCSNAEAEWNKAQMEVAEQALNARDAAVARAERAERERDELILTQKSDYCHLLDAWRERGEKVPGADKQSVVQRVIVGIHELRDQRDAALTEARRVLREARRVGHGPHVASSHG